MIYTKIETKEEVPASTITNVKYQCAKCNEHFCDLEDLEEHYGEHHFYSKLITIGDKVFYKIETQEDAELALKAGDPDVVENNWTGPGYYYFLNYSRPCSRGCCDDSVSKLLPAQNLLEDIESQIRDLQRRAESIIKVFNENGIVLER